MNKFVILSILVVLFISAAAPVLAQTPDITSTPGDGYVLPPAQEVASTGILTLIGLIITLFAGLIGVAFVLVFRAAPPALQKEATQLGQIAVSGLIKLIEALQKQADQTPTHVDNLALAEARRVVEEQAKLIDAYYNALIMMRAESAHIETDDTNELRG